MPNAKCDKCNQFLDTICHDDATKDRLRVLINERAKKRFGVIYDINPGVHHHEVDPNNTAGEAGGVCKGCLWYKPFSFSPPGVQWGGAAAAGGGGGNATTVNK